MKSLKALYQIGNGPSSSHTIAPKKAALDFLKGLENVSLIKVVLFSSLAFTGKGHKTDEIIISTVKPIACEVEFDYFSQVHHPNTMTFKAYKGDMLIKERTYLSLGGGAISCLEDDDVIDKDIYPFSSFKEIKEYMNKKGYKKLSSVCKDFEDENIDSYFDSIVDAMFLSIENGLSKVGEIQAGKKLFIKRDAKMIYEKALSIEDPHEKFSLLNASYAYAVSEENASGGIVVTTPTCGSAGVLPSILYPYLSRPEFGKSKIKESLYAAGIIGNLFKKNASISGSVGGCQAEIGVAVCMACAALCDLHDNSVEQIEYGCELAMEHQLGLTCDPIDGFVAIPCIERNAIGALRARNSYLFAKYLQPSRNNVVTLDDIITTMKLTGEALPESYKETSLGSMSDISSNPKK